MAVVDLLVLATLVVGVTLGALRGFVPQVTGIFGLGGGLYLAARFHAPVRAALFDPNFGWSFNGESAFISIIVATVLLAALAGFLLRRSIEALGLVTYDRIVGAAFGAAKAALLAAGILLAIVYFAPDGGGLERAIGASHSGPVFWRALERAQRYLPAEVAEPMEAFLVRNRLPERTAPAARRPAEPPAAWPPDLPAGPPSNAIEPASEPAPPPPPLDPTPEPSAPAPGE
jgi:membrane protein required for colicin V production